MCVHLKRTSEKVKSSIKYGKCCVESRGKGVEIEITDKGDTNLGLGFAGGRYMCVNNGTS